MTKLPKMVQALLEPRAYPEPTGRVKLVQTQMSFVLLTDNYVYKVKKPVDLGYLDYTTLEKRKLYCHKEVELNRRLCPDVYLDVVPITQKQGNFFIAGQGRAMEYAVKMRRLPQELMMDTLLTSNRVSPEMMSKLAQKLVAFHGQAETNKRISTFGSLDTINQNTEENFSQTGKYMGKTISPKSYRHIKAYSDNFLKGNAPLFRKRIQDGRIRDCHGDLHAAHICFTNGICIYDCIEFNDRFRYADVASEVAFLAMDLDHYGRADLSHLFIYSYVALSQDRELLELLAFYKCYRAYVRGKVESFKLDDPYITEEEKGETLKKASGYFDLAHAYTKSKPILLITTGLMGSGKSALAQALAKRLGLVVISSDVTRKRLASIPETEHRFEEFDAGIYSPEFTKKTYDTMLAEAKGILKEGGSVIIDASFIKAEQRLKAKSLAEEIKTRFFVLECALDEELTRKRLTKRLEQGSVSDGRWEIFSQQKEKFEPVVEVPPQNRVIIDSSQPIDKIAQQVLDKINKGVDNDKAQ
jgi:aminoglycoside phosphotransferase family enzyme/predicted kinase